MDIERTENGGDSVSCATSDDDEENNEQDEFLTGLVDFDGDEDIAQDVHKLEYEEALNPTPNIRPISQFTFEGNEKSQAYFWQEYMHMKSSGQLFGGIKGVTWRSINQTHSYKEQNMLELDDAKLMFLFADHALNNNGKQQEVFYKIIHGLIERMGNKSNNLDAFIESLDNEQKDAFESIISSLNSEQTQVFNRIKYAAKPNIKAPTNVTEANALLLKGKYSIFANIPNAAVSILADHAVVSLDSLIDHIMAQGIPILWMQDRHGNMNTDGINGCPSAIKLHEEFRMEMNDPSNTAFGLLLLWSDGFLRVYVKQKKNSVWIMTLAVLDPNKNTTSIFHTYCIAIGNSNSDHTPVLEYFLKELEILKQEKVRYCGISGEFIKTSFGMFAYSSDRIERCDLLKTLQGGTYGICSHFACAIDPNKFPFCDRCFDSLTASLLQSDYPSLPPGDLHCELCCRWDSESESPASRSIPLPAKYPQQASSTSPAPPANRSSHETCVVPVRQQFSWLKQGVEVAHHNLVTEERDTDGKRMRWTKEEAANYLRTMAINESVQADVYQSAKYKRDHPHAPTVKYIPSYWESNILMEWFLNSPMHLLFHGLVSAVMDLLYKFMTLLSKQATFERLVNKHLSKIESFRLEWLKAR